MPAVYDPEFLDQIEALEPAPFDDGVWRHMFNEYNPTRPNTRGARWNPPDVAAIYTSLDRPTAIAEADYAIAIQPIRPRVSRQVYEVRVTLDAVVDLSDRSTLAALGVGEEELTSSSHTSCQAIGGATHWLGRDGLLVPSARAPGTNLVVFADRMNIDAAFEILSREDLPFDN